VLRNVAARLDYPHAALTVRYECRPWAEELDVVPLIIEPHQDGTYTIAGGAESDGLNGKQLLSVDQHSVAGLTSMTCSNCCAGPLGHRGRSGCRESVPPIVRSSPFSRQRQSRDRTDRYPSAAPGSAVITCHDGVDALQSRNSCRERTTNSTADLGYLKRWHATRGCAQPVSTKKLGFNLAVSSIRGNEHILCSHRYSLLAVAPNAYPQRPNSKWQQAMYGRCIECSCTSSLPRDDVRVFGMKLRDVQLVDVFLELLLRDVRLLPTARNAGQQKHNDDTQSPAARS
jgi:hypothetical protein